MQKSDMTVSLSSDETINLHFNASAIFNVLSVGNKDKKVIFKLETF